MDDFIADALEKGLISFDLIPKDLTLEEAKRRWVLLTELQYTRPITHEPDVWIAFLRINRGN